MIDALDFCVSFVGENSGVLARLFFGLWRRYPPSDTRVTLHLVNKQVSDDAWVDVLRHALMMGLPTRAYDLDTGWNPYRGAVDSSYADLALLTVNFNDAARTAEWCVDNCGSAEWCILSHFDVVWSADVVSWLVGRQQQTGAMMVGGHCPVMLLNRPAYHALGVGFDSREEVSDVGHALARAIGAVGFDPCMEWCFHHMGGGGGYHSDAEFQSMRERAREIIHREGL